MSKAADSFWLDGGYDRASVEACRYHPNHAWIKLRLGDVLQGYRWPDDPMTICKACYVPRCGESEPNGCDLPRHHEEDHLTPDGVTWPIGGTDPRALAAWAAAKSEGGVEP